MESVACPQFRSLAVTVVPEAAAMSETEWLQFFSVIDHALERRPRAVTRQLRLFLRILNLLSLLRYRRPLHGLTTAQRIAFLGSVEDSRLLLFRRGFWGLRTLALMGYYARPEYASSLGYRAAPRGWELRR